MGCGKVATGETDASDVPSWAHSDVVVERAFVDVFIFKHCVVVLTCFKFPPGVEVGILDGGTLVVSVVSIVIIAVTIALLFVWMGNRSWQREVEGASPDLTVEI